MSYLSEFRLNWTNLLGAGLGLGFGVAAAAAAGDAPLPAGAAAADAVPLPALAPGRPTGHGVSSSKVRRISATAKPATSGPTVATAATTSLWFSSPPSQSTRIVTEQPRMFMRHASIRPPGPR